VDWLPGYLTNCFLLIIPIVVFNVLFMKRLPGAYQPEIFERNIPKPIVFSENAFRIVVFLMPLFMPLRVQTDIQETGVLLYVVGIVVYFASWLVLIRFPESAWANSPQGFLAPAYTPLLWLLGIALIGDSVFLPMAAYRWWWYAILSVVFLSFHVTHTWIVFARWIEGKNLPT
jgi:hypothetical protein